MEIAKLVLEYLKVLTWPLVILLITWQFRPYIERLLSHISDRLRTAETLKLGLMGQEVQISGTAKELALEKALLTQGRNSDASTEKIVALEDATRELNNPIADLIGMTLVSSPEKVRLETIVHGTLKATLPGSSPQEQPSMMILLITKAVEKMLASLQRLSYVVGVDDEYELTPEGRKFFLRVQDRQSAFLARFHALGSSSVTTNNKA